MELITPYLEEIIKSSLTDIHRKRLLDGMNELKTRAKTVEELADLAAFYVFPRPIPMEQQAVDAIDATAKSILKDFLTHLQDQGTWRHDALESLARSFAEQKDIKLGSLAKPLRCALTGRHVSPGIFDVMVTLGQDEVLARLEDILKV